MAEKSQKEKIIELLNQKEWVCVTEMMALYIPDYRRRLCDLKEDGFILTARRCTQHNHSGGVQEWHLVHKSDAPSEDLSYGASRFLDDWGPNGRLVKKPAEPPKPAPSLFN